MAGHSHWKQIKEHKGVQDKKRGALFSKLLRAVTVAAKQESNPQFNPRLRTTIEKARAAGVASDTIERAVSKAGEAGDEEVLVEAYAPGGAPLLIYAITGSRNKTIQELKHLLNEHGAKFAEPGSVRWAFEDARIDGEPVWRARFPQTTDEATAATLRSLVIALDAHDDVQKIFTTEREG